MTCFFGLWDQLHFQIAGWKASALTLARKVEAEKMFYCCWARVRETFSKSNSPRESTETPQRSTPSSLNTSTGTGSQSQSLRSVDGLKGEITTHVHCNMHIHTFICQKITWLFLETHVAQKHSVLIVGSREIVLCGTDLRKLIIKSLQGSMC